MMREGTAESKRSFRLRAIALPAEHGSWGLVVEPIALGLLVAPSAAGACLAVGAFATFLTRRPLKIILAEWGLQRGERATPAARFALLYGGIALLGVAACVSLTGVRPLLPLLAACPLVGVFLAYDFRNQSRTWQAEFAGAGAFALVAAGIALAGGWLFAPAFALTGVLVARTVPSILYVRGRVRLDRHKPHDAILVLGAHVVALVAVFGLIRAGVLPWLAVIPFPVLLLRAAVGLSAYRRQVTMKTIGWTEMSYGIVTVLAVVVGYWTQMP